MTHPTLGDDPRLAVLRDTTDRLLEVGSPLETVREVVLGEEVEVFARRPRSLHQVLAAGTEFGDADCYVFSDGVRVTFMDLGSRVAAVAARLKGEYGLSRGDRVAIAAANSLEWITTFWAVTCSEMVVVAMNGWWTGAEMHNALDLTEPTLILLDERRRDRLGDTRFRTAVIGSDWAKADPSMKLPPPPGVSDEDAPAMLIFTSGTTGRPKAAVLSQRGVIGYLMLQQFMGARSALMAGAPSGRGGGAVRLAPYPLFHVSGLSVMVGSVMNGSKTVWPLGRFDPSDVIRLTKEEAISAWGGGVTHVVKLLESPALAEIPPAQIVSLTVGGSATSPDIINRVEAHFPHLKDAVSSGYGSTETGGLATWAPGWMVRAAPDCVGPPIPTVSIRITDESGDEVAEGHEGNIEIRSPYTMLGYWKNPEADQETIRSSRWVRSGDFGRLEQGILFVLSRRRDLIIRGGENVYPFEIEYRICEHPGVVEAAVFGIEDPTYGQKVKAVVVVIPSSELDTEKVRSYCAETLAYFKVPDVVEVRTEALPRNATGKVMKHVLSGDGVSGFAHEEE